MHMINRLALVILGLFAGPAWCAQLTIEDLASCRTQRDDVARLACYDALPLPSAAGSETAASRQGDVEPASALTQAAGTGTFGLRETKRPSAESELVSSIPGTVDGWASGTRWLLANGQTWQVVGGKSAAYVLKDPKVRISRGLLGNYVMEIEGVAQLVRVRRIQ